MGKVKVPITLEVDVAELRRLLREIDPAPGDDVPPLPRDEEIELPASWRFVETVPDVTYRWGDDVDEYDEFRVYEGTLSSGETLRMGIGKCDRNRITFEEPRAYYIVMAYGPAGGMRAISEFLATDDYEQTHETIAIIKGKDGSGRQFNNPAELPSVYRDWRTTVYRERVGYPGAYTKQALVCREDDYPTMLNHSLAQIQLRGL